MLRSEAAFDACRDPGADLLLLVEERMQQVTCRSPSR